MNGDYHAIWGPDIFAPPTSAAGRHFLAADGNAGVSATPPSDASAPRRSPRGPVKVRETLSMRMRRANSERMLQAGATSTAEASTTFSRAPSAPCLSRPQALSRASSGANVVPRSIPTLEELCIVQLARSAATIQDGALDIVPDYIRQRIFEGVRVFNQNLLSGRTLVTLCKGAHFSQLNLRNAANVRDPDLMEVAPSLGKEIHTLDLSHCSYVTDEGLGAMLRHCSSLTSLSCEKVVNLTGETSLRPNSATCALRSLKTLSLAGCEGLVDLPVRSALRRAPDLVDLSLASCERLTDEAIDGLKSDELRRLSLAYCSKVSDVGLSSVVRGCARLEKLDLTGCGITDASLHVISARLPGLKSLDVSFVERVTDAGIELLARQCTGLESLSLEQNQSVTDASMHALAEHCKALQHLNVSFCHLLNESGILRVFTDCKLRTLHVTQCRRISSQTRFWLVTRLANAQSRREEEEKLKESEVELAK